MINWKIRFKNPTWVVTAGIPQLILIVQLILAFTNQYIYPTGYTITEDAITGFMGIVNSIAILLGIGGAVLDPTTKGFTDSGRALTYNKPKE